ncbi:hypothetical protein AAVH_07472 [Aphelenchoides avenae]|nr:hypothetical protein AAVH_07472 [Aphelenchus avenae]
MPWYVYGSAVYMPILEGILLVQFVVFTKYTRHKWMAAALCITVWCALVAVQSLLDVYRELEWLSIVLWSAETFPQVFLNMRRRSTYGLSNFSVLITAIGKTTDFLQNYLLIMPLQYVIMAFFSSTVAQIGTLQVIVYWSRRPVYYATDAGKPRKRITRSCQILRVIGGSFLVGELATFAVALVLRTRTAWLIAAPASVYLVLLVHYVYVSNRCPFPWLRAEKVDPTDNERKV